MRSTSVLAVLLAGCLHSHDERIAAFGASERGDLEGAATALSPCLYSGDVEDQFLCRSLFADVRYRQKRWREAAAMYELSFELRDHIAKDHGFGSPSLGSLTSWGYALVVTQQWARAKKVLARAAALDAIGEPEQLKVLIHIGLREVAKAEGEADAEAKENSLVATRACDTDHLEYFQITPTHRLGGDYLPIDAWLAIGDACGPHAGRAFFEQARDQARVEHDSSGEAAATHRLGP